MELLTGVDWRGVFMPTVPVLEIILRGSIVYLGVFALFRVILARQMGSLGMADLLVLVLVADAAQNAMAGNYNSVPDGLILVATLIFWSYALDWLGFHFPRLQRLLFPPPFLLVKDGQMLFRNMRRELISREELLSQLRLQGVNDLAEVKRACMESDGRISVVKRAPSDTGRNDDHRRGA
ncbi:MAG: YetF domain-containing protein [Thermoguttaceae bacterium]|jgi:uncharacterized membrane protein YcaP (DUF421 family)